MEFIRKVNLSLYYKLKYSVLSNYIEFGSSDLEFNSESNKYEASYSYSPNPAGRGRGIYPFDVVGSGIFASCLEGEYVKIYHSTGQIPSSDYTIDYTTPGVTLISGTDVPVMFEYKWNYISIIDEWPYVSVPDLPFILLDFKKFDTKGFQLGGGKKHICDLDIHVFGSSKPELDDLTYIVHTGLYNKCLTLFGFNSGDVFSWDGTFNPSFSCACDSEVSKLEFVDVEANYLNLPVDYKTDINAYRSKISLKIFAYKEA
jgi:hypothetical protein